MEANEIMHCHMFGHEEEICNKNGGMRKEWRMVQKDPPQEGSNRNTSKQQERQATQINTPQSPGKLQQSNQCKPQIVTHLCILIPSKH